MEVAGLVVSQGPIFSIAQGCRSEFRACTQLPELVKSQWAYNRLSDFDLWDSGVGASTDHENSLDFRLRDDETSRKVVITSLSTLRAWTSLCRTLAQPKSATGHLHNDQSKKAVSSTPETTKESEESEDISIEEAQNSVEELQALLVKLGVAIRQAGKASRLGNADRSFEKHKNDSDIVELVGHLKFILRLAGPAREVTYSDNGQPGNRLDTPLTICRVNDLREPLEPEQDILIKANAQRRYRFHYAKIRSESLGALRKQQTQFDAPSQATAEMTPQDQARKTAKSTISKEGIVPSNVVQQPKPIIRSVRSLGNSNQLSAHKAEMSLAKAQGDIGVTAPPTARAVASDYPKAPKIDPGKVSMRCPYCHMTFSSKTAQSNMLWRKHVSDDLQPYTCYFQDCPQGNCFFDSFKAWKAHVLSEDHQTSKWMCYYCDADNFDNVTSFGEHLNEMHESEVIEEDLSDLVLACQTQESPVLDKCPICLLKEGTWISLKKENTTFEPKNKDFLDHIGDCLHSFALRALPPPEQDDQDATSIGAPKTPSSHGSLLALSVDAYSDVDEGRPGITEADMALIEAFAPEQSHDVAQWMETSQESETVGGSDVDSSAIDSEAKSGKEVMTEAQIQLVALELSKQGFESWSRIPRTYCVMKHINMLRMIDPMIDQGWTDLWIPSRFNGDMPSCLGLRTKEKFAEAQGLVLDTLNTTLKDARHYHFANDLPFQSEGGLNSDSMGQIDRITLKGTSRQYTRIRVVRTRDFRRTPPVAKNFMSELSSLLKLQEHRHILRYVGSYTDPRYLGIVLAPITDYSLREYLDIVSINSQRSLLRTFFGCLTSTLAFVHRTGIRHGDIKPTNVLIKNDQVFITGFGSSESCTADSQDSDLSEPTPFTPLYAAPEVVSVKPRGLSADIWSLGCVFLEIWTVLCGKHVNELRNQIQGSYQRSPDKVDSWLDFLAVSSHVTVADGNAPATWIRSNLQEDPNARPTAQKLWDDIREHSEASTSIPAYVGRCCCDSEDIVLPSRDDSVEEQSTSASKQMTGPPSDPPDWIQGPRHRHLDTTGLTQRTEGPSFEPRVPRDTTWSPLEGSD